MKQIKLLIILLCIVSLKCIYATQANIKEQSEQKIKSLGEDEVQQTYKLVLPNEQSMEFEKPLLEQSEYFKTAIDFRSKQRELEQGQGSKSPTRTDSPEIMIAESTITTSQTENPDEVSLQDLHDILSTIVAHQSNSTEALRKLLFAQQPSLNRMLQLFYVAMYFDINPLQVVMSDVLQDTFAKNYNKPEYKNALVALPDNWQKFLTQPLILHYPILKTFLTQRMKLIHTLQLKSSFKNLAWSPDGMKIASSSRDLTIWDAINGTEIRTFADNPYNPFIGCISWSPDGMKIATGDTPGNIIIWDIATGARRVLDNGNMSIHSIAWSADGGQLAAGISNGIIKIFRVATGSEIRRLQQDNRIVTAITWSLDGHQLFAGYVDSSVSIWDLQTGTELRRLYYGLEESAIASAWSPDKEKIAFGLSGGIISILNITAWRKNRTLGKHGNLVLYISWSPDGTQLASTSMTDIKIWDVIGGSEIRTFQGRNAQWSPKGTSLAIASKENSITIWNFDLQLSQLTISQMALLEKIIKARKVLLPYIDATTYESLPQAWKDALYEAGYGIPTYYEPKSLFTNAYKMLTGAYEYIMGKK